MVENFEYLLVYLILVNLHLNKVLNLFFQNEEERQQQLRDRAKKLIAEARKSIVSASSTAVPSYNNGSARSSVSPVSDRSQTSLFHHDKV